MRRLGIICLLAVVAVLFSSCERRPFSQNTTAVNFKLNINTEINTGSKLEMPDMMRVDLFDITNEQRYNARRQQKTNRNVAAKENENDSIRI
jgi:hypothetical protein